MLGVWAGFHFRYADEDGSKLGRKVARFVRHEVLPAARLREARDCSRRHDAKICGLRSAIPRRRSCFPEHRRSFCCAVCCLRLVAVSTDRAYRPKVLGRKEYMGARRSGTRRGHGTGRYESHRRGTIYIATMAGGIRRLPTTGRAGPP